MTILKVLKEAITGIEDFTVSSFTYIRTYEMRDLPCKNCICLATCRIRYLNKYEEYKKIYDQNSNKYNKEAPKSRAAGELSIGCVFISEYLTDISSSDIFLKSKIVHQYMTGDY